MSLVHLIPVISSTATLTLAVSEYQSLIPWLTLPLPTATSGARLPNHLSAWFDRWFKPVLVSVVVLGITSTWGGYAAWKDTLDPARALYKYGTGFALAHFAFAPPIAQCILRLVRGHANPQDELVLWLKIHTVRTLTTDVPAFLCFVRAFLHTI